MSIADDFLKRKEDKKTSKINVFIYVSHEEYKLKDILSELPPCVNIKDTICENRFYLLEIDSKNDFMILKDIINDKFNKKTNEIFKNNNTLNNFFNYPNFCIFEDRELKTIEEKKEDFYKNSDYKKSLIESHKSLENSKIKDTKENLSLLMSNIYNIDENKSKIFIDFISKKVNSFFKKNSYFSNNLFLQHLYSDFDGEIRFKILEKTYEFNKILENQKKTFFEIYSYKFIEKLTKEAMSELNINCDEFVKKEKINNDNLCSKIPSTVSFTDYERFSFFNPNDTQKYDFDSLVPFVREVNSILLSYNVREYRSKIFDIFDNIKDFNEKEIIKTLDNAIKHISTKKKQENKIK